MNDVRLIDANVLLKVPNVRRVTEYDEAGYGMTYSAIPDWTVMEAPAIDAVEVVRCRKCKHFVKYDDDYRDEYGFDGYCEEISYIMDGYYRGAENRNADDYCSRGAKMDAKGE